MCAVLVTCYWDVASARPCVAHIWRRVNPEAHPLLAPMISSGEQLVYPYPHQRCRRRSAANKSRVPRIIPEGGPIPLHRDTTIQIVWILILMSTSRLGEALKGLKRVNPIIIRIVLVIKIKVWIRILVSNSRRGLYTILPSPIVYSIHCNNGGGGEKYCIAE